MCVLADIEAFFLPSFFWGGGGGGEDWSVIFLSGSIQYREYIYTPPKNI